MTTVSVLGAGIMGSGIAQLCATAGHDVALQDVHDDALERAAVAIDSSLERLVRKDRLDERAAVDARARIRPERDLAAAVAQADVVIEAVPERLDLKLTVWADVARHAPDDALLATNTSQLSITRLATAVGPRAGSFIGLHFFNPAVLMRLVEVVRGLRTADDTTTRAVAFARGLHRETVVCQKDSPGFITTRAYAALRMECLRMLEEGLGSAEDIDTALKLAFNLPMGPLELADFNGLDTVLAVMDDLRDHHGDRFRAPTTLRNLVAAGHHGRKTGAGFYDHGGRG